MHLGTQTGPAELNRQAPEQKQSGEGHLHLNPHKTKAASPILNVWEEGDKWHQLLQERWGIPSCTWAHKCHLEAAWITSSIHSVDKSIMQEILRFFTPGFPWVPEADIRLTHCHGGLNTRDLKSYRQTGCICPKVPPGFAASSTRSLLRRGKNPKPSCSWYHTKYLFHG